MTKFLLKNGNPLKHTSFFPYTKVIEYKKLSITEDVLKFGIGTLNESMGSFKSQKDMACLITEKILDTCLGDYNGEEISVDLSGFNNKYIKSVTLKCYKIYGDTWAEYLNIGENGEILMKVNLSLMDVRSLNKKQLFKRLSYIIAHELMHANIMYRRYYNAQNVYDYPEDYDNPLKMKANTENDAIISGFAYALYNTCYQEMQAMISQTNTEIFSRYKGRKLENSQLVTAIKDSMAYGAYSHNLKVCTELKNNPEKKKELQIKLKENGINIPNIGEKIKSIEFFSKEAIERIYKNAMLYNEENN